MSQQQYEFSVGEPRRHEGNGVRELSYWTYTIKARTPFNDDVLVERRYNDFSVFRACMSAAYPFCIIPPIPEKEAIQGMINKISLVSTAQSESRQHEYRQRALRHFLVRLAAHPLLQQSSLLQEFLDEGAWQKRVHEPIKAPSWESSGGSFTQLLSFSPPAASDVNPGTAYQSSMSAGSTDPKVWQGTLVYVNQLDASLHNLKDKMQNLVQRRKATGTALAKFGESFCNIGEEERVEDLKKALVAVGEHGDQMSKIYDRHATEETQKVIFTLSYYLGMCQSVREALRHVQAATQHETVVARKVEELEKEVLRAASADRRTKLQTEQQNMQELLRGAKATVEEAETTFKAEMRRFHKDKQYDMKELMKNFADLQIRYATEMRTSLDTLKPVVEKVSV